jgi:hypothetical protein
LNSQDRRALKISKDFGININGTAEEDQVFLTAILTSWLAPCTVYESEGTNKTYTLLALSFTTFTVYSIGLVATYGYAAHANLSRESFPPGANVKKILFVIDVVDK